MGSAIPIARADDLSPSERASLLDRSGVAMAAVMDDVEEIVETVAAEGDDAVRQYTARFDDVDLDDVAVANAVINDAGQQLSTEERAAIDDAAAAIERFHERERPTEWFEEFDGGVWAGQLIRPLEAVGCYAPGGAARYPSSVLMTAIPARVAGVEEVVLCSPPTADGGIDAATLYAAAVAGVDRVFAIGGAQAIAALAHGTEAVPSVDAVVGPGNVYVTAAKRLVADQVEIDVLAGPSEVLIIAESTADPVAVAWDLIAQSEHGPDCASVLVTMDESFARSVQGAVDTALAEFTRADVVTKAFETNGQLLVVDDLEAAIAFANEYAPEHLQLMLDDPTAVLEDIRHAGTVFLGHDTSTSLGDYALGPSHVLPTSRAARTRSGLSVASFVRTPSVQRVDASGLEFMAGTVRTLADMEGLPGHARAVEVRRENAR